MKTRDLIVLVSLQMFNEEGEANLSAVDIANELDISPGNLYYHFKGKSEILAEIFSRFQKQLSAVMWDRIPDGTELDEVWLHTYVILEVLYNNRFFFRNLHDFNVKYPDTGQKLNRLIDQFAKATFDGLSRLSKQNKFSIPANQKERLQRVGEQIMLTYLYYPAYKARSHEIERNEFIEQCSLQILAIISPYLTAEQISLIYQCHQHYMLQPSEN